MITNERVAALAVTDHEALITLLALAIARGQHRIWIFDGYPPDPMIRALMDEADRLLFVPSGIRDALAQWNAEMREI